MCRVAMTRRLWWEVGEGRRTGEAVGAYLVQLAMEVLEAVQDLQRNLCELSLIPQPNVFVL